MLKRTRFRKRLHCLWVTLLFGGALLLASSSVSAQLSTKISIKLEQQPLPQALKQLQQHAQVVFALDEEALKQYTCKPRQFNNETLQDILSALLKDTNYEFNVINGSIVIRKKAPAAPKKEGGRVTGKILDKESGQPVAGATIRIGNTGTTADIDGAFSINLPIGIYTASISYIGYVSKDITDLSLNNQQLLELNVTLDKEKGALKEVVIHSSVRKESVAALYSRQKNAAGITDGISAEQISRTPDKNLGEVLKRVSGLSTMENKYVVVRGLSERYNQAVLNGQVMPSTELNRKNFNFEIIPSNLIENVTVYKTITPDRSAEFGGGLVEVNTIDVPSRDFFTVAVGTSYNDKTTGKNFLSLPLEGREYFGNISKHRYWLGSKDWKHFSDMVSAYDNRKDGTNMYANNWILTKMKAPLSSNFQFTGGKVFNKHFGMVATASYRNTFATQDIYTGRDGFENPAGTALIDKAHGPRYGFTTNINGLAAVGYHDSKNKVSAQVLYLRLLDQQLVIAKGSGEVGGNMLLVQDISMQSTLLQNQLKGEHLLGNKGIKLQWLGSYIYLDKLKPDNHVLTASYYGDSALASNEINIQGGGGPATNGGTLRSWSRALEKNYTWNVNVAIPINTGKLATIAKAGYNGWAKDRIFFVANSSTRPMTSYSLYQPLGKYYYDTTGTRSQLDKGGEEFNKNINLQAFYAMFDNKFGKLRLVWGARAEYYNLNNINDVLTNEIKRYSNEPDVDYSAVLNQEPNWRFFPSANFTYSLTSKMNLRLSYAESIIRPDVRELSFFKEYDYELGGDYLGEAIIRSTTIKHFDFRYEWYPSAGEIISASLFHKEIKYPMEIYREGSNRRFKLKNNKDAKNTGVELEFRKSFAFTNIPVLRNITLSGNFTYLDASVRSMSYEVGRDSVNKHKLVYIERINASEKRPQAGAANYILNGGIYYDTKPVSVSVMYNYVANRMFRPQEFYAQSIFEQPLRSLDAQIAIRMLKNKAELRLTAANILNKYSVIYQNRYDGPDPAKPTKKELQYKESQDDIDYRVDPGRTFSATLSYKF